MAQQQVVSRSEIEDDRVEAARGAGGLQHVAGGRAAIPAANDLQPAGLVRDFKLQHTFLDPPVGNRLSIQ